MYCMRKLHSFYVSPEILSVFYNSVICSVWRYCLLAWGGNISKCEKDRLIKRASRIIGTEQTGVGDTYRALLPQKLHTVWTDVSHPLHNLLADQLIVRSGRLRLPSFSTKTRYPLSFIEHAIPCHNCSFKR
ncbi:hypothetical protein HOLleu_16712 [Holothuria leucospilota]|uniref:Uncharacterized protein n=1 Tax=Holothuria leucospilota TaxID=206669 RepID=A0A9Q1C6I8_HOLLE|nr:hypothetical protein HOLleu_16712 [Holothuria leucospilota]